MGQIAGDGRSIDMIIHGDCLIEMSKMKHNSIDFIVTDPPYGLNFMGKQWDGAIPAIEIWAKALNICKPGAMLAAFGGSRTHHHLMCAIEGAGWEIRDVIMWIYGSGFPKSHNHFGIPGYGTALKPAYEPIILAMKPCDGTFKQNAEKWGLGGINIDGCRVGGDLRNNPEVGFIRRGRTDEEIFLGTDKNRPKGSYEVKGRWPANVIFDEEARALLDQMSGFSKSSGAIRNNSARQGNSMGKEYDRISHGHNDSGGASRFFYCAKASSKERNAGCEGLPLKSAGIKNNSGRGFSESDPYSEIKRNNSHPTVKPIALMKYIIKLLAPPGNPTLLDPFCGSGSTLIAAKELGINAIGIEKEEEYCQIANKRIEFNKLPLFDKLA